MKKYYFILFLLLTLILITWRKSFNGQVLSESTSMIIPLPSSPPSPIETPTPEPTLVPTPTPKPTKIPTPIPTTVPQPSFTSEQINGFIDRFAAQYSVSPDIIRYIALCEAGFKPEAKKLIYGGLFQFNSSTWKKYRRMMGEDQDADLRFNAEEAVQTAAYVLSINQAYIWPNCVP